MNRVAGCYGAIVVCCANPLEPTRKVIACMVKDIVTDEKVLSQVCEPATIDDMDVVQDLIDTAASLEEVAGLHANQIGVSKCIALFLADDDQLKPVFNFKLVKALYPVKMEEECFSVEGAHSVTRYECATIAYEEPVDGALVARKKEFHGRESQILQHLIDHSKGKII